MGRKIQFVTYLVVTREKLPTGSIVAGSWMVTSSSSPKVWVGAS